MGKRAWEIDSNEINLNELDTNNLDQYIILTKNIEEFIKGVDNKKLFLMGPKGIGKTLILKAKSQLMRDVQSGYQFIPEDNLCEKFSNIGIVFSAMDLNKFKSRAIWHEVWEIALLCLILKRFKVSLPIDIENVLHEAEALNEILAALLQNRGEIDHLHSLVATFLKPSIRKIPNVNQIAIFIDSIDEAFDNHVGYNLKSTNLKSTNLSPEVWINSQNSILKIAKDLCDSFKHIKIYLTVRSEAYINNNDPIKLQLDQYTTHIRYNYNQLENIFNQNIESMNLEDIFPNNETPIKKFVGYDKITHSFVENSSGDRIEESVFGFIYRHTFGRPREIMEIGKTISEKFSPSERTPDNIRSIVNEVGYELFGQLKKEIVPYFEDDLFLEFSQKIRQNVITCEIVEKLRSNFEKYHNVDDIFLYFYRMGVLGYVDTDIEGNMIQKFLPAGEYSLSNHRIPDSKYYLLHPSLNESLKKFHKSDFYDHRNIIGYDYSFLDRAFDKTCKHVHFGLDRDSLAIVIPELNKCKCLTIIQRPDQEWTKIEKCKKVTFQYNNAEKIEFLIYHDNLDRIDKNLALRAHYNCKPVIFYTQDRNILLSIIKASDTLSFGIPDYFLEFKPIDLSDKFIYFAMRCYDESQNAKINYQLEKFNAKSSPMLIDRFLLDKSIQIVDNVLFVVILVEDKGSLICIERPSYTMKPSEIVVRCNHNDEFTFYTLRQNKLIEGVYQFYKLLKQNKIEPYNKDVPNNLLNIFILIQVNVIKNAIPRETLQKIFPQRSSSEIVDDLIMVGMDVAERTNKLSKKYPLIRNNYIIELSKRKAFFPMDEECYNFVSNSDQLDDFQEMFNFLKILKVKPLIEQYKSVFISYSNEDIVFARHLRNFLVARGVDVFFFELDSQPTLLKELMQKEIYKRDIFLFIASKNSLMSEPCQFELSNCQEKQNKDWSKDLLVTLKIDDYIFEINKHNIPQKNRDEFWSNIQFIKDRRMLDYKQFMINFNRVNFQEKIIELIYNNFLKETEK